MANGPRPGAASKDQEDSAAEHMEGITAPPASPADTNPSIANRTADKETDRLGLNDSTTMKPREITSPAGHDLPPRHAQSVSPKVGHPEKAATLPLVSIEAQSGSVDKLAVDEPDLDKTTSAEDKPLDASPQNPMMKQNSDFSEQTADAAEVSISAQKLPSDERKATIPSEGTHTKQAPDGTNPPSHPSVAQREPEESAPKGNPPSLPSAKQEPDAESNAAHGLSSSDNPVSSPTELKILKNDEKPSEEQPETGEEDKPLLLPKLSDDEVEPGKAESTADCGKHLGSTSPQHFSKGQTEDHLLMDSEPGKVSGTNQEESVIKEEEREMQKTESIVDHPPGSRTADRAEDLSTGGREGHESEDVVGGKKAHEVGIAESSSDQAKQDESAKKESISEGKPRGLTPVSSAANEYGAKDQGLSKGANSSDGNDDIPTGVGNERSNSKPNTKPVVERIEPLKETPATEQGAAPMDIDSAGQQLEAIPSNEKMGDEKDSEDINIIAGKGPIDVSKIDNKTSEDVEMTENTPSKTDAGLEKQGQAEDDNTAQIKKSRKNVHKATQSQLLRARSNSRGGAPDSSFDSGGRQDSVTQEAGKAPAQKSSDTASQASKGKEAEGAPEDDGPRPVMEAKGLAMRVGNAVFVTEDQLDQPKIARLNDKKVLPFERLTFKELRTYNRDQLRAYCFAYGMERRKKTEMEADMARYLSYWNRGKPEFALHEYIPTSGRIIDRDEFFGTRGSQANQSAASLGGSSYSGVDVNRRFGSRMQSSSGGYGDKGSGPGVHGSVTGNLQTSPSTLSLGNANRNARAGSTPTSLPRGFGTSFKQRVHARQASAKFKAAYNGAGDTIVNVVENAAAYFEGKDSPEVIADQTKSFARYQFNVDLLTEIFDGPIQEDVEVLKVSTVKANGNMEGTVAQNERGNNPTTSSTQTKTNVMFDIAKRLLSNKRSSHQAELDSFETNLKRAEEKAKHTERRNMRLFQRLERAETVAQVEAIKKEFETEFGTPVDFTSRPVVRRKIDKSLPPLVIPDDQSRILRFTFL